VWCFCHSISNFLVSPPLAVYRRRPFWPTAAVSVAAMGRKSLGRERSGSQVLWRLGVRENIHQIENAAERWRRKLRSLAKLLMSGAISLCALMSASAQATTLLVTWTEPDMGVSASWEMSATPTPLSYVSGLSTDVPIFNFSSTGAQSIGPYPDIIWFNTGVPYGGLFNTPSAYFTLGYFQLVGPQAYSGPESAPVFLPGVYQGLDYFNNLDPATVTISVVGAPGPLPGAGFAGLAALALVRLYSRRRRA
jgi:hypothetical protein